MKNLRAVALYVSIALVLATGVAVQQTANTAQGSQDHLSHLSPDTLREWLTYLSSDELEGRATFSEGLGLAAAYIAEQLKEAGVKPGGDGGSYFQRVAVLGVQSTNRSTVTVDVNGVQRTFESEGAVRFPDNVGGKRTLTLDEVEFVGYGLNLGAEHNDYAGLDVKGKAVVWLGSQGPASTDTLQARRLLGSRASIAVEELGAAATIAPGGTGQGGGGGRGGGGPNSPDFTTVQRLDNPVPPNLTATDEFMEFLFSAADVSYDGLLARSERRETLPRFTLSNVTITFNIDADYRVVNTQYTRNVVGIVEGTDPQLKDTYVGFGAHYDHVGYQQGPVREGADRISNGADDDGSGTSTLVGLARAFATGPRPRRSLVFVWHSGEERGLWGSRYFADYPTVPMEKMVAQLNMDMIGRNRDNLESENNTVLAVGSDRISTELHNVLVDANENMAQPLRIDYEMNDPSDPERIYYRSDHYSYAAKGVPVIFFFTGLHPDYHRVSDTVDKINFEKMSRVGRLVYETGWSVANMDHAPVRDNKGPRMGRGSNGKLP